MRTTFLLPVIFVGALILYLPTLAPGLLWGSDFAIFQTMACLLEIQLPGGIFGDLEGIRQYFEIQPYGPVYRLVERSP